MEQKTSSTTFSNFKNSSMQHINLERKQINLIFPSKEINSSGINPCISGISSDSNTESIFVSPLNAKRNAGSENQFFPNLQRSFSSYEDQKSDQSSSCNSHRPSVKKWRNISIMFKSIRCFQENDAMKLDNIESLDKIMEKFEPKGKNKNRREKTSEFEYALDLYLNIEKMIDCSDRGGPEDLEIIKAILEKDPKKYLISTKDPEHLINNKNRYGYAALYTACKNGHLNIVRYLIENEANPYLKMKIAEGVDESPLEVATRWGHKEIIDYLLQNVEYCEKDLKECLSLAIRAEIKHSLIARINLDQIRNNRRKKKKAFFDDFLSYFCC